MVLPTTTHWVILIYKNGSLDPTTPFFFVRTQHETMLIMKRNPQATFIEEDDEIPKTGVVYRKVRIEIYTASEVFLPKQTKKPFQNITEHQQGTNLQTSFGGLIVAERYCAE